jgi:cephalosporin hydroxylase
MMKELINQTKGIVFVILGTKHTEDHVKAELETITPLLRPDDYLVVEDTVEREDKMRGMMNFMQNNNQYVFDSKHEQKFGVTLAKHGFWIKR